MRLARVTADFPLWPGVLTGPRGEHTHTHTQFQDISGSRWASKENMQLVERTAAHRNNRYVERCSDKVTAQRRLMRSACVVQCDTDYHHCHRAAGERSVPCDGTLDKF